MSKQLTISAFKALGVAAIITVASGCANTAQIDEANSTAQRAMEMAENAMRAAEAASSKADAAMSKAEEAQTCCQENQDKIDKMFERSQYK